MLRSDPWHLSRHACVLLAAGLFSASAEARDEPRQVAVEAAPSGATPSGPRARPLQPGEEERALPPGHPRTTGGAPPDEGPADEGDEEAAPHPVPGMFQPPPDVAEEDPAIPPGTLVIEVKDADNKPVPRLGLVLTTLHQSVAKGQSKDTRPVPADDGGRARVDHLETGSAVSYWVKYQTDGATFASPPTQLNVARGVHVVLHVYPVVHDVESALVVAQGAIYFEVKDDRVQVEQAITFFNFGKTAWAPQDLVLQLPTGFTALTSQAMMSDQGVDTAEKQGARVRGTFAPGRHDLEFRWQLPYDGEKEVTVDVNAPPHTAVWRVLAAAGHQTTLEVTGFPEPQKRTDRQGQHILVTEKQVQRNAPLTSIHVTLRGLSVPGPGRFVATGLAGAGVLFGLVLGVGRKRRAGGSAKSERAEILAEIEELERAHLRGDVGPKAYASLRRHLVDALAEALDSVA